MKINVHSSLSKLANRYNEVTGAKKSAFSYKKKFMPDYEDDTPDSVEFDSRFMEKFFDFVDAYKAFDSMIHNGLMLYTGGYFKARSKRGFGKPSLYVRADDVEHFKHILDDIVDVCNEMRKEADYMANNINV